MIWILGLAAAALVYVAGDLAWMTLVVPVAYRPVIGPLLAASPDLGAAVAFYGLYLVGMAAFAIAPGVALGRWLQALWRGALLGLVAYGTYDLTNQATLRLWSINISVLDMGWGALITSLASAVGCAAALRARAGRR